MVEDLLRRAVHRLRLGRAWVYGIASGEGLALVDAGSPAPQRWQQLAAWVAGLGYGVGDVRAVLLSHAHVDHVGLAERLQRSAGAEVWVHGAEAAALAGREPREAQWACAQRFLLEHGAPPHLLTELRGPRWSATPVVADRLFADGDELAFGRLRLRVVHSPGHSPGSTVFLWDEARLAFTGDHLLGGPMPVGLVSFPDGDYEARCGGVGEHLRSLERLRSLTGWRGLPGHGRELADVAIGVAEVGAHYRRRLDAAFAAVAGAGVSAFEVAQRLFDDVGMARLWPALSQVVGYLEALATEGRLVVVVEDGAIRFRRR